MDAVSEIKQKLDIVDVVGFYITLKKAGKNYSAVCPFHSEKTPSFNVSAELQIFKCFGCGESGDMFSFVEKIEGVDFNSALKVLADRAGVVLEQTTYDLSGKLKQRVCQINLLAANFYNYLLRKHSLGKPGKEYFTVKRGLSETVIQEFLLGYAPANGTVLMDFLIKQGISEDELLQAGLVVNRYDGPGLQDKYRGRVMFPFIGIDGKIVGFSGRTVFDRRPKYLNTSETVVFHKSQFIYALNKAKLDIKKNGAVLVEGPMDVISAHQQGLTNVVAASGTAVTDAQLLLLNRYTKDLTLCLDSDLAGINAAFRTVDLAEKHDFNIKVALMPEGFKDLDELVKRDKLSAERMLDNAVPAYDFFISATLRMHNKHTSDGKKRIMEDLQPKLGRIQNKVLKDHYSSELSRHLGVEKETILQLLNSPVLQTDAVSFKEEKAPIVVMARKDSRLELYIIALLLKLPYEILVARCAELKPEDFLDEEALPLFKQIRDYVHEHSEFSVARFLESMDQNARNLVQDLYIGGMPYDEADNEAFIAEVNATVSRVKYKSTRRRLKELSEKIRLAEGENNDKLIAELSAEFQELSKKLI